MISFRRRSHLMINPRIFFLVLLLEFLSTEISVTAHILSSRFQLDEDYDSSLEKDLPVCDTKDELIPHMQCFLYYTCENSEPKLTLCQVPLAFNTKTGKCDQENNVIDCVDGIRVLPGSREPPFFFNPFRSTIPSSGTTTTIVTSTTPEMTTEKSLPVTTEATTIFTKITSPGRIKTTKQTTISPPTPTPKTTSKILENETESKTTTSIPLTTESKIVTLRKYVENFPIFSTKMTPSPIDHISSTTTARTSTSELPLKRTTTLEYETTPDHTTTRSTTTSTTTTTRSPSTTATTTTTLATTRMPERGCQPIKIIIHHYPGPCKAEFTCNDGSSFIVEHCTSHLLWRPARMNS